VREVLRDKWIEVDVDAVKKNLQEVKSLLDDKARLIAVVKANAYGHGAEETARIFFQNGVDFFAVSFFYEALQLRKAGIRSDILVFSPVLSEEEAAESIKNQLTLTIASNKDREMLERVAAPFNTQIRVHLKIDTGLGRFGMSEEEALRVCQDIYSKGQMFIEGIYTHVADPTSPDYTLKQFQQFMQVVNRLEREKFVIPIKHFANSAVFLSFPNMYLDAVRIGTLLSGQHPVGAFPTRLHLQDPYKFKSRILSLRTLEKGSSLGYYRTYILKRTAQIAVIPVGFNDGLTMEVANRPVGLLDMIKKLAKIVLAYFNFSRFNLFVTIKGKEYPIRGKVFMQMALVEIPDGVDVNIGDEVELPVRKTLAANNIIRIYVEEGQTVKIPYNEVANYIIDEA
jgi:alanine racemase